MEDNTVRELLILQTIKVKEKHFIIEYIVKEQELSIFGQKFLTRDYLSFLQWTHVKEYIRMHIEEQGPKQVKAKVKSKTIEKVSTENNMCLTISYKRLNLAVCDLTKTDPASTHSSQLEVLIEMLPSSLTLKTESNPEDCKLTKLAPRAVERNSPVHEPYLPCPTTTPYKGQQYLPNSEKGSEIEAYEPPGLQEGAIASYTPTRRRLRNKASQENQEYHPREAKKAKVEVAPKTPKSSSEASQDLFGEDSESEAQNNNVVDPLEEKYRLIEQEQKAQSAKPPSTKKRKKLFDSKVPAEKKKESSAKRGLSAKAKLKKDKREEIEALQEQERKLRKQNEELKVLEEEVFKHLPDVLDESDSSRLILTLPEYSVEELRTFYDERFRERAQELLQKAKGHRNFKYSVYNLTMYDFTPSRLVSKMYEIAQENLGEEGDMGMYDKIFTGSVVPEFAFDLFQMAFYPTDVEEARAHLEWQKKAVAKLNCDSAM